jgi:hypothetical protein
MFQPHDHVERRSLSGTVGSQQSDYLALLHMKADIVNYPTLSVSFFEVGCRQSGCRRCLSCLAYNTRAVNERRLSLATLLDIDVLRPYAHDSCNELLSL